MPGRKACERPRQCTSELNGAEPLRARDGQESVRDSVQTRGAWHTRRSGCGEVEICVFW